MTDKKNKLTLKDEMTEFLLYTTSEGEVYPPHLVEARCRRAWLLKELSEVLVA